MDAASLAAEWLSFIITAVGLGSLITQASAIREGLDPYHTSRTAQFLGSWKKRQPVKAWNQLVHPIPVGPVIHANLVDGFCSFNVIGVSRLPVEEPGKASWTAVLATFHDKAPSRFYHSTTKAHDAESKTHLAVKRLEGSSRAYTWDKLTGSSSRQGLSWPSLQTSPLTRHNSTTCITISRTALITILVICNSRPVFRYSDASGHRASYASYCGHFYIEWPLGGSAVVRFHPHSSHSKATDVYPVMFPVRVNKCVQMLAGVITSADGKSFQCAFPGRKSPGNWTLDYQRRGFPGAHGSRHLYNLMGGKVYEVDFLYARRVEADVAPDTLELRLPSTQTNIQLSMLIPEAEERVLELTMDCLPWSSLSWSIHRGLRDILVAYAKPTMDKFRHNLASRLHNFINEHPHRLTACGWSADFVTEAMADLAANSVLAGSGNSGDSVRVVTDAAVLLSAQTPVQLDEVDFWQKERHGLSQGACLSANAIVALTKGFILEWSNEFDYQMYHDLPPELHFS